MTDPLTLDPLKGKIKGTKSFIIVMFFRENSCSRQMCRFGSVNMYPCNSGPALIFFLFSTIKWD